MALPESVRQAESLHGVRWMPVSKKTAGIGRLALQGFCIFRLQPAMMRRQVSLGKEQIVVPLDFSGESRVRFGDTVDARARFLPLIHRQGGQNAEHNHEGLDQELG